MQWWVESKLSSVNYFQPGAGVVAVLAWTVWVIGSITLHELGHGWAALRQGDPTPREMNRMTLNPYVHMGPISLLIFAVIGIAWGVMPIRPFLFREGRLGEIKVALAGPAVNLILAIISIGGMIVGLMLHSTGTLASYVVLFFFVGAYINLVLLIFNLIPVPPLDGSNVLRALVPAVDRVYTHPNAGFIGLAILFLAFSFAGDLLFGLPGLWVFQIGNLAADVLGTPDVHIVSAGILGI